jgi:hypothetical protein
VAPAPRIWAPRPTAGGKPPPQPPKADDRFGRHDRTRGARACATRPSCPTIRSPWGTPGRGGSSAQRKADRDFILTPFKIQYRSMPPIVPRRMLEEDKLLCLWGIGIPPSRRSPEYEDAFPAARSTSSRFRSTPRAGRNAHGAFSQRRPRRGIASSTCRGLEVHYVLGRSSSGFSRQLWRY